MKQVPIVQLSNNETLLKFYQAVQNGIVKQATVNCITIDGDVIFTTLDGVEYTFHSPESHISVGDNILVRLDKNQSVIGIKSNHPAANVHDKIIVHNSTTQVNDIISGTLLHVDNENIIKGDYMTMRILSIIDTQTNTILQGMENNVDVIQHISAYALSNVILKTNIGLIALGMGLNIPHGSTVMLEVIERKERTHNTHTREYMVKIAKLIKHIYDNPDQLELLIKFIKSNHNTLLQNYLLMLTRSRNDYDRKDKIEDYIQNTAKQVFKEKMNELILTHRFDENISSVVKQLIQYFKDVKDTMMPDHKNLWINIKFPWHLYNIFNVENCSVYVKHNNDSSKRIIVDVNINDDKIFQIDSSLMWNKNKCTWDVLLRHKNNLSQDVESQIRESFNQNKEKSGIAGKISFEHTEKFFSVQNHVYFDDNIEDENINNTTSHHEPKKQDINV
jgi:hypothetical protein